MQRVSNWRIVAVITAGLLVVCAFAAAAMTEGVSAEDDSPTRVPAPPGGGSGGKPGKAPSHRPTPTLDIAGLAVRVVDAPPNAWVQVQWSNWFEQDWYPVDAWSGKLSQNATGFAAVWYTAKDYYTGPFRYVIFDEDPAKGGQVWGMSLPFYLGYVGDFRMVEVHKGENLTAQEQAAMATPDRSRWFSQQGVQYKNNPAGCGRHTIAGEVLSTSGRPLSETWLRLTYPTGVTETVKAGGAPDYGPSGFSFLLGKVHIGQPYKLELLLQNSPAQIAPPVQVVFSDNCTANYAWVVFQANR